MRRLEKANGCASQKEFAFMNKVSAGVTLTATWPHAVREPVDQYAGPIKEPEHLALCQARKPAWFHHEELVLRH